MSTEISERGNTYVANINVRIASPNRFRIELEDASPDSFLIELGATGDGRFAINADPGQPCPYDAIEFVFTVGEDYAFVSRGFVDGAKVKNSGWSFGPVRMSGSQCSVTAHLSAGTRTFDDYVLLCQAMSSPTSTLLEVGPNARRGSRVSSQGKNPGSTRVENTGSEPPPHTGPEEDDHEPNEGSDPEPPPHTGPEEDDDDPVDDSGPEPHPHTGPEEDDDERVEDSGTGSEPPHHTGHDD